MLQRLRDKALDVIVEHTVWVALVALGGSSLLVTLVWWVLNQSAMWLAAWALLFLMLLMATNLLLMERRSRGSSATLTAPPKGDVELGDSLTLERARLDEFLRIAFIGWDFRGLTQTEPVARLWLEVTNASLLDVTAFALTGEIRILGRATSSVPRLDREVTVRRSARPSRLDVRLGLTSETAREIVRILETDGAAPVGLQLDWLRVKLRVSDASQYEARVENAAPALRKFLESPR